jgi:hypothetical protein
MATIPWPANRHHPGATGGQALGLDSGSSSTHGRRIARPGTLRCSVSTRQWRGGAGEEVEWREGPREKKEGGEGEESEGEGGRRGNGASRAGRGRLS